MSLWSNLRCREFRIFIVMVDKVNQPIFNDRALKEWGSAKFAGPEYWIASDWGKAYLHSWTGLKKTTENR